MKILSIAGKNLGRRYSVFCLQSSYTIVHTQKKKEEREKCTGVITYFIKCLLYMHENLSWRPSTHIKN